jgi:hypothetical protein
MTAPARHRNPKQTIRTLKNFFIPKRTTESTENN